MKSHSATNVNWAAVESEWRMCSAILRRSPRSGTRVSPAGAAPGFAPPAARRTSSAVIEPPGPLPPTASSATPSSFASARTAGAACARAPGGAAGGAAARVAVAAAVTVAAWAGATAAAGTAPSLATAIEMITVPTGTTWPSAAWSEAITPARGEGISTLALSVMTSTSG